MIKEFKKFNKGFILILTLIVMSFVLMIGLGIYNIILKEIQISNLGKDSQIALYAADSGIECALYWDIKKGMVSSSNPSNIKCFNRDISLPGTPTNTFESNNLDNNSCVRVTITKSIPPNPLMTEIKAYGYDVDCSSNVSRKVERGVKVTY